MNTKKMYAKFYNEWKNKDKFDIESEVAGLKAAIRCREFFPVLISLCVAIFALFVGYTDLVFGGTNEAREKFEFLIKLIYLNTGAVSVIIAWLIYAFMRTQRDSIKLEALSNILKNSNR